MAFDLGVTGAPETFLIFDNEIIAHVQGEINQQKWESIFLPLINNNQELIKYKSKIIQSEAYLKSKKSTWYPKLNISSNSLPSLSTGEINNKLSTDTATNQLKYELNGSITWNIIEPSRKLEIKKTYPLMKVKVLLKY